MVRLFLLAAAVAPFLSTQSAADDRAAPDEAGYKRIAAPFFAAHCNKCHAIAKPKGEFGIDAARLPNDFNDPPARARWKEIVNVLNSHAMPPEKEPQPKPADVAAVVDWITEQTVRAEQAKRQSAIVLRRLNREEYRNTIRELIGIDFDPSVFPQDPPAGGFDNNGGALTVSPLHMEMYLNAAREILDRALVEGERPKSIRWRFQPKVGAMDRTRVRLDPQNNPLVNGNNNRQDGDWVVIHHHSWDKNVGARDFRVPVAGTYVIRVHAAGRVPGRERVVATADAILKKRKEEEDAKNPKGARFSQEQYDRDLLHF